MSRWRDFTEDLWTARDDSNEIGDTRRLAHIAAPAAQVHRNDAVIVGFACDAGVARNQGRIGAASGPEKIRKALAGLPAHGLTRLLDAGDVVCEGDALEVSQQMLADRIEALLVQQAQVVALGGGHEIAWASFQGLSQWMRSTHQTGSVLVLNLDAHFDLRTGRPASSGTPFDQMACYCAQRNISWRYACLGISRTANTPALYARAQEIGAFWIEDQKMQERHLPNRIEDVRGLMKNASHVYLTIDLDVLPAGTMPGVSAPAPYGVPLTVIEELILEVKASGKLRLSDIAEYNPRFDQDDISAKVAARLAWQLLF